MAATRWPLVVLRLKGEMTLRSLEMVVFFIDMAESLLLVAEGYLRFYPISRAVRYFCELR